ncbi:hypothetical protein HXX76_000610 [Chlamydomonas incerta]|uniref:JmjC domain-containing protein n=1 Tax=Chlamydomonas incerta TaxID=51695 RepID=A0A835WEK7_CHLIN|nr:hypothetical protein HXX76_000610 [Chlamydomonas incerta]|eukprot:KAG2446007.1 hypothetical protein HXX76_000610 [Chlamydomonas incerta]
MYIRDGPNIRESSLGALAVLPDALLLDILAPGGGGGLGAADLGRLAAASRVLYCFANLEESWKGLVLEELGGRFTWAGCWQRTYLLSTGRISPQQEEQARRVVEQEEQEEQQEEKEAEARAAAEAAKVKEHEEEEQREEVEGRRSGKRRKPCDAPAAVADRGAAAKGKKAAAAAAAAAAQKAQSEPNGKAAGGKGKGKPAKGKGKKAGDAAGAEADEAAAGPGPSSTAAAAAAAAKPAATANGNGAAAVPRRPLMRRLVLPGPLLTAAGEDDEEAAGAGAAAGKRSSAGGSSSNGSGSSSSSRVCLQRYLRVRGFYSDLLYQPWFCANFEMPPDWLRPNNIDRRAGLTPEQFRTEYEIPNRPVILTDAMSSWPAMSRWSNDYFTRVFGDKDVIVGNMPMPFSTYAAYAAANADEMPLYLFDKQFTATAPALASDYCVPAAFGEDLFGLLGEAGRPDYRWLILGPARSGSSFHVDPNATSAWNGLVWGAKKWVMFPPGVVPPGVHPSPDGADVATPVSLTEWFVNFYPECAEMKVKPVEFVARPGELLFVPRGWWHCALNLTDSCAITQNFVSAVGLQATLSFLKSRRPEMVSGCAHENRCSLYDRFVAALRAQRPAVLAAVEARQEEARAKARESNKLAALFKHGPEPGAAAAPTSAGTAAAGGSSQTVAAAGGAAAPTANGGSGSGFSFGFSAGGGGGTSGAAAAAAGGEPAAAAGGSGGFRFGFGL